MSLAVQEVFSDTNSKSIKINKLN